MLTMCNTVDMLTISINSHVFNNQWTFEQTIWKQAHKFAQVLSKINSIQVELNSGSLMLAHSAQHRWHANN